MAALLSAWALVVALMSGSMVIRGRDGASLHVLTIVALYTIGGVTTGALMGGCRGLLRWRAGAVMLGAIAAIPFGVGIGAALNGFSGWERKQTIVLVIFALAFGGPGGLIIREFVRSERR